MHYLVIITEHDFKSNFFNSYLCYNILQMNLKNMISNNNNILYRATDPFLTPKDLFLVNCFLNEIQIIIQNAKCQFDIH